MSGHSKWSKIKHKKAATDAQKSKVFSKFAQLVAIESKKAGGDINSPGLRAIIERAKQANMPSANIERAVKKGAGKDAASLEEITYEAYGPGGSAIIVYGVTNNKNRTTAEVKHLLGEHGASLAEPGAASWAFEKTENEWTPKTTMDLSDDEEKKLEALAEALKEHDDIQSVFTNAS